MSEDLLPPQVAADPTRGHLVSSWVVPMTHGGTPVQVRGELTWSPPPPAWVVWPLYTVLALVPIAAVLVGRGPRPLGLLLGVGGAAAVYHAATTPEPAASVSSHARSEEHTSELKSRQYLHSFPTRRSSDLCAAS